MKNNFSLKFNLTDIIITAVAVLLIVASIITTNLMFRQDNTNKVVNIYYQNELLTDYQIDLNNLKEDKVIVLSQDKYDKLLGDLVITISKEKGVSITEATCPNHICVKQGFVNRVGYPVVCVPNGVYVIITSKKVDEDILLG